MNWILSWNNLATTQRRANAELNILAGTNLGATVSVTYKSVVAGSDPIVFAGAYPTLPAFSLAQATAALADGLQQAAAISTELVSAASASAIQWTAAQTDVASQLTALESTVTTAESEATVTLSSNNYAIQLAFTQANASNAQALIGTQAQIQQALGNATAQSVESSQLAQLQFQLAAAQVRSDQDRLNTSAANEIAGANSAWNAETVSYDNEEDLLSDANANHARDFNAAASHILANLWSDVDNADVFWKSFYSNVHQAVTDPHTILSAVSMASYFFGPAGFVIGRLADVANSSLYFEQGHYYAGSFSAITLLPLGSVVEAGIDTVRVAGSLTVDAVSSGVAVIRGFIADSTGIDEAITAALTEAAENAPGVAENLANDLAEDAAGTLNTCPCFVAGTQVYTSYNSVTGAYTEAQIQTIYAGEQILSQDQYEPNGPMQLETVTGIATHTVYDLRQITILGSNGTSQTLDVTDDHPFYVEGQGWVGAQYLMTGEQVQEPDGTLATITGNADDPQPNGVAVYSLDVGMDHTFFVSASGADFAVWVHNCAATAPNQATLNQLQHEAAVNDFIAKARINGFDVAGTEVYIQTPFSAAGRRVDVLLRNPLTNDLQAIEIKSSLAAFNRFDAAARQQFAADRWINQYGAQSVLGWVESSMKILWTVP